MKCPRCNSAVKDGASFCTQCGFKLINDISKKPLEEPTDTNAVISSYSIASKENKSENESYVNRELVESIETDKFTDDNNGVPQPDHKDDTIPSVSNAKLKKLYVIITIIGFLTFFAGGYFISFHNISKKSDSTIKEETKDSLQIIQDTKYFVKSNSNGSNTYYAVELKISWPNYIESGDIEPLQRSIMDKAFGFTENTIDEAISSYYQLFGNEISELPELTETTWDREYITISIEKMSHVKGKFISFSINYFSMPHGGSIHAADIWDKYVNYDIEKSRLIKLSDILVNGVLDTEIFRELKRSLSIDWNRVDLPSKLPNEMLLTEDGLRFELRNSSNEIQYVDLNLSNEYISPYIKRLFQVDEENNKSNSHAVEFLRNIYENYIFARQDFCSIASNICSKKILKRLKEEYEYDCVDGDCYAVWLFRTCNQDGYDDNSAINSIIAKGNGWYDVSYSDMGWKGRTSFKLIEYNGKMLIDEILVDKSYYRSNYKEQEENSLDENIQQVDRKSLIFFKEPAYLMANDDIQKELIGSFFWQCASDDPLYFNPNHDTLGFTITMNGLEMLHEFVNEIYNNSISSNINGAVPANAKYENGHWYKQHNTKNNATMYFLVGHEINIEVMNFVNRKWIGNEIIHHDANPNSYIIIMRDENDNWYYVSKKGQYVFKKKSKIIK